MLAREVRVTKVSTVYCTEPEGRPGQPRFLNCVLELETDLTPRELKYGVLRRVERDLGRVRTDDKYAPRTIDLDLIVYHDFSFRDDELRIPDPEILARAFLAVPLAELAPDLTVSAPEVRIGAAAAKMSVKGIRPLERYTSILRKEI